ncbi:scavenger receptor cysteine-rich type 1 protein M130-like isoform X2 [Colossoma macropomum]|uniref:scavenger receptor cysteine-rich type 1 protein M130-like isoform X2 n=1 Tax=Colossoma macropomum TaxID=42526 RepID=UPI001864C898|nr:scavenger receptor cysteine-rich type 1 protein M130-like isoform X2 [Colossoma macropomum]
MGVSGSFRYAVSVCSDSVRLVDGAGRCSGRLEVKAHQSWTTVCEASFDLQDAEVVCRELDCGPPLTLQGALYGEGKHPFGNKEFQCKGTENRLLTCSTSDREEQNCTHGKAVGLTCSDSLSSTIINIKLLVFFVVLFLMLITCLTIFLIFKTSGLLSSLKTH